MTDLCSNYTDTCCIFYNEYRGCKPNPERFKKFMEHSFEIEIGEYKMLLPCKYYITENQLIALIKGGI